MTGPPSGLRGNAWGRSAGRGIIMAAKKLGFGMMRLPQTDPNDAKSVDMAQVCRMVDAFLERGFTYFDTAYMYHSFTSEEIVRESVVKRHPRDSFTLATKMPVVFLKREKDQDRIFNEQLKKCGVDYFDYYLLHDLGRAHYKIARRLDTFGYVAGLKQKGLIRQMGFSFHDTADVLDEILNDHPEVDFVQLQVNYLDWDNAGIQSRRCLEVARAHHKPVIVMEPVKGGSLAKVPPQAEELYRSIHPEMSVASWALRFAASQEDVMMVLSGMSSMEQLEDNMSFMDDFRPLDAREYQAIESAVQILNGTIAIPCTACRYCTDGCPKQIDIPKCFALYNADRQSVNQGFSIQQGYYETYTHDHARASDCIGCGKCEQICPQHLPIRRYLRDVAAAFEK